MPKQRRYRRAWRGDRGGPGEEWGEGVNRGTRAAKPAAAAAGVSVLYAHLELHVIKASRLVDIDFMEHLLDVGGVKVNVKLADHGGDLLQVKGAISITVSHGPLALGKTEDTVPRVFLHVMVLDNLVDLIEPGFELGLAPTDDVKGGLSAIVVLVNDGEGEVDLEGDGGVRRREGTSVERQPKDDGPCQTPHPHLICDGLVLLLTNEWDGRLTLGNTSDGSKINYKGKRRGK